MAQVVAGNKVKLNNGQTIDAAQGGWYDAQQFWGGTLSAPGVINSLSNQQGAGQAVSAEVNRQTSVAAGKAPDANQNYINSLNGNPNSAPSDIPGFPGFDPNAAGAGNGAGLNGALGSNTPLLNLPDLYKSLTDSSGVGDIEAGLTAKAKSFADAQSKINDNPYLSEANRTGRLQKLQIDYQNDVKNDQDSLAMKKQDIATQLDLQTKQFDINSQAAKQALDEFNTLLQSGALSGATGNDIAAITKATGISSSAIQAAVKAQAQKDVQTSVTTVDDGTNVYSVVINAKTGQIISKQVLSQSKPSTAQPTAAAKDTYYANNLRADAQKGLTLSQIFSLYTGYLDPNLILQLYNANSKYGPAKESVDSLAKYGVKPAGSTNTNDALLKILSGGQ